VSSAPPDERQLSDSAADRARPVKHSFSIRGHRTSISLEASFWLALRAAAADRNTAIAALVAEIDASRGDAGLSSAIRVWILRDLQQAVASFALEAG
jgi:predicted DNA-binding ribbon-helix-helix protein